MAVSSYQPPKVKRFRVWPMKAVRDALAPQARKPDEVFRLENCYAQDTEVGPLIVGRPGFWLLGPTGTSGAPSTSNLGTNDGTRRTQLIHQFTKRDGTEISIVIVEGRIYTLNWSTQIWSEPVSTANLTTASITLSDSALCYAVTFGDTVVISDGVNTPWSWDGTAGAGGLTSLTNAPVFYGPMVVHYAKLMGIKASARGTFVWSEEGLANTGYEAGGYNNAWDFVQTSAEGLTCLAATNDALYVFRANSHTAVIGAITTDFRTTGTREALDPTIGTISPAAVIVIGNAVWFVDQYGIFRRTQVGNGCQEIGHGAREYMKTISGTDFPSIQAVDDVETGHVRFAVKQPGGFDELDTMLWLNREDGRYASREYGYALSRLGLLKDAAGLPTVIHGGGGNSTNAADGWIFAHGHLDQSYWNDGYRNWAQYLPTWSYAATSNAIVHVIETPPMGYDTALDKMWVRGELSTTMPTNLSAVSLYFTTPNGLSDALTLSNLTGSGTPLGTFVLGVDTLASEAEERKATFQMRQRGRWCRMKLTHSTKSERFAISELALEAVAVSRRPGVN